MSVFVKDLLSGVAQYTDNMSLSLAIGQIAIEWNPEFQKWWDATWVAVPLVGPLMTSLTLAAMLTCLMSMTVVAHITSWLCALSRRDTITAARVAGLLLFATMDETYHNIQSDPRKSMKTPSGFFSFLQTAYLIDKCDCGCGRAFQLAKRIQNDVGASVASWIAKFRSASSTSVALFQPLVNPEPAEQTDVEKEVVVIDVPRVLDRSTASQPLVKMVNPAPVEETLVEEVVKWVNVPQVTQAHCANALTRSKINFSAAESRFIAKVVLGCSARIWFKTSYLILVLLMERWDLVRVIAFSIATSLMHVAMGTEPYLAAAWKMLATEARYVPNPDDDESLWEEKAIGGECGETVGIWALRKHVLKAAILLWPVWGSVIRIIAFKLCPTGVFAFTEPGCVPESRLPHLPRLL